MSDSEAQIAAAHAEFMSKFKPEEERKMNEAKDIITAKEMTIDVEGFTFKITTKILPKHIRLLTDAKSNYDESNPDYDKMMDPLARFMAAVSLDEKLDEAFWSTFDDETGYLADVVSYVVQQVERYKPTIKSFR